MIPARRDMDNLSRQANRLRREWLRILVKELEEEITKRGISKTGGLWKSLSGTHGPNVSILQYLLYGAFVDMGVGRGRGMEDVRETAMINRVYNQMMGRRNGRMAKKYRWYSKRMAREQHKLAELMAELYADACADELMNALPSRIEII